MRWALSCIAAGWVTHCRSSFLFLKSQKRMEKNPWPLAWHKALPNDVWVFPWGLFLSFHSLWWICNSTCTHRHKTEGAGQADSYPASIAGVWGKGSKLINLRLFTLTRAKLICETFPMGLVGCWKQKTICFSYWHTNCYVLICQAPLLMEGSHPLYLHLCMGTALACSQRPFCNCTLWQRNPDM